MNTIILTHSFIQKRLIKPLRFNEFIETSFWRAILTPFCCPNLFLTAVKLSASLFFLICKKGMAAIRASCQIYGSLIELLTISRSLLLSLEKSLRVREDPDFARSRGSVL